MTHLYKSFIILALSTAITGAATAQDAPSFCKTDDYRQLDFWVGDWDLSWDLPNGQQGRGNNLIEKTFDDCVITENFIGGTFKGTSHSLYHAQTKQWRQTWVDNQGGYFDLVGGPTEGGGFILTNVRLDDSYPHLRMVWVDIKKNSLTWRWQKSDDGKTWVDTWVIHYKRRKD